jgi:hypothetical protein
MHSLFDYDTRSIHNHSKNFRLIFMAQQSNTAVYVINSLTYVTLVILIGRNV